MRTIVVGYDATRPAKNALAYAAGLVAREGAGTQLIIAWIDPGPIPLASVAGAASVDTPPVALTLEACELLDDHFDIEWRWAVRRGDAANELERLAEELRADLLVVGRSALPARHILGSVAGRLARQAKRPVLVVP